MPNNYPVKLIAFDFDGVIADSLNENIKITNIVCSKLGAEINVTPDLLQSVDCMSFDAIAAKIKLPHVHYSEALKQINKMLVASYCNIKPFEGICEVISELYDRKIHIIINTHNTVDAVKPFLKKHDLHHYFSEIFGAETPGGKDEKMMIALENNSLCSCSAMLIGDSVGDITDAQGAGVIPAGVAWGFQSEDKLLNAGAEIIFQTPADIPDLIGGKMHY
jgi:phosphoglycolate phosphatase